MSRAVFAVIVLLVACSVAPAAKPPERDTEMDKAIDKALAYLHEHQNADGSWQGLQRFNQGPETAVTSLAVMAFLAAGHVPGEGRYGKTIENGIRRVLSWQKPNGLLSNNNAHYSMYQHGISTLMLAEVAGMTEGELGKEIRKKLQKAVNVILQAQKARKNPRDEGGWRYQTGSTDSDMSLTGWQVMALRAAKNLGCDVPAENIERAVAYIKRCQQRRSGFCYQPGHGPSVACTGTGILALEICGKKEHRSEAVLAGGAFLIREGNLPRIHQQHFSYSIYYGAQAAFQLGGNYWSVYRPALHKVLLDTQRDNGSWIGGASDRMFGPNYATSMAVLALAVEYRFLPIYQRGDEPTDRPR
jgi:hypothetical protein